MTQFWKKTYYQVAVVDSIDTQLVSGICSILVRYGIDHETKFYDREGRNTIGIYVWAYENEYAKISPLVNAILYAKF